MPRNPTWTASNAAAVAALPEFVNPAKTLIFTGSSSQVFENQGSAAGEIAASATTAYVKVALRADAAYAFVLDGSRPTSIDVFDASGYLLLSTDGDSIGTPDGPSQDSIFSFVPDATGNYVLRVAWADGAPVAGTFTVSGAEDIGGDFKNGGSASNNYVTLVNNAFANVLRHTPMTPGEQSGAATFALNLSRGDYTMPQVSAAIAQYADATTSVATLAYQFFVGQIPTAAGMDYLVSPTGPNPNNLNSAYYQDFNLENRYINFAVNLGKLGAGRGGFEQTYGSKTLLDTMKSAYQTIFGSTPTDDKAHALLDSRIDYFAYYGQDGNNGIGTKAALVGWLLAEAAKADIGTLQTANLAFLNDLSDGAAFGVNLVGTYVGTPFTG